MAATTSLLTLLLTLLACGAAVLAAEAETDPVSFFYSVCVRRSLRPHCEN